ncbi:MAG: enoyl-CoA hydratase-related protein [Pseudomonadota bacterium]
MTILRQHLQDGWLTLTLDDPDRRNALSDEMSDALRGALGDVREDRSVRGITLRGSGGVFCAGGDLKAFKTDLQAGGIDAVMELSRGAGALFAMVDSQPQPVIALVDGPAMAGGLGLVCCADVVAVTPDARFALTEVNLGIVAAQIAPYILRRFGPTTGRRLMVTAARFDGQDAYRLGLADHLADDAAALEAYADGVAASVRKAAPGAIAATKALCRAAPNLDAEAMTEEAARVFAETLMSEEGREGIAAFAQKRQPKWAQS